MLSKSVVKPNLPLDSPLSRRFKDSLFRSKKLRRSTGRNSHSIRNTLRKVRISSDPGGSKLAYFCLEWRVKFLEMGMEDSVEFSRFVVDCISELQKDIRKLKK